MNIEDPHDLVDKRRLASMCQIVGLPRPEAVKAFGTPGRTVFYGIRFKKSSGVASHMLRVDLYGTAHGAPADHWIAANAVLGASGLPARPTLHRLPDHVFGKPAVLFPFVELSTGARLVSLSGDFWPTAARDVGRVVAELAAYTGPSFGLRAVQGAFVAMRRSWADEWCAHAYDLLAGARAAGLDFGPLSDAVHAAILDRRDALETCTQFGLVHGELKPSAILYEVSSGHPQLAGIEDWDTAMLGDPLVEAGFLLSYPPQTLAPVLEGVGEERVRSWLEPDALARIEAYHLTLCATRPRYVAEQIRSVGGTRVLQTLELARQHLEAALEPGFVKGRIEAALEIAAPFDPPRVAIEPSHSHSVLRAATLFSRGDVGVSPQHAPLSVAAMGAALLGCEIEADSLRSTTALEAATALLSAVEPPGKAERTEPIADRSRWRDALLEDVVVEGVNAEVSTSGLLLVWLFAEAQAILGDTLSDAVLRGIELTARAMARHERALTPPRPLQIQHTIYGLAAIHRLEAMDDVDVQFDALTMKLQERLLDLVDPVEVASIPGGSGDAQLLPLLADAGATAEQRLMRPVLIYAIRCLREKGLPATETALVALMGG